jgi:hypothetical protein
MHNGFRSIDSTTTVHCAASGLGTDEERLPRTVRALARATGWKLAQDAPAIHMRRREVRAGMEDAAQLVPHQQVATLVPAVPTRFGA